MNKIRKPQSRKKLIALLLLLIVAAAAVLSGLYVADYYHASDAALECTRSNELVEVTEYDDQMVFTPKSDVYAGLIFYPGGKVEWTAYAPLMQTLATQHILCVLVKMPANLAILDINAADGIREDYPMIATWMIGGHSLGGAMAAEYVAKHPEDFSTLLLLGAYSTKDLSDTGVKVVCMYGSQDQVMNRTKYEKYKSNLPSDFQEIVIEGGCHSYFGSYGMQKGDGTPTISEQVQFDYVANAVLGSL